MDVSIFTEECECTEFIIRTSFHTPFGLKKIMASMFDFLIKHTNPHYLDEKQRDTMRGAIDRMLPFINNKLGISGYDMMTKEAACILNGILYSLNATECIEGVYACDEYVMAKLISPSFLNMSCIILKNGDLTLNTFTIHNTYRYYCIHCDCLIMGGTNEDKPIMDRYVVAPWSNI